MVVVVVAVGGDNTVVAVVFVVVGGLVVVVLVVVVVVPVGVLVLIDVFAFFGLVKMLVRMLCCDGVLWE